MRYVKLWLNFTVTLTTILFAGTFCSANEMPMAGIAANGIIVKDESNIQIEKEYLYICNSRIDVSYIFRNNSDKDIVTEVAFPIPKHKYSPGGHIKYPVHGDFKVFVNGNEVKYETVTRALFKDVDYTALLSGMKISFMDFGNCNHFFEKLSKVDQKKLLDLGLMVDDGLSIDPQWSVETTYYWKQTFPAKSVINIKHTFKPNVFSELYYFQTGRSFEAEKEVSDLANQFCLDSEQIEWLKSTGGGFHHEQVDYILTTANHWKKPIKEFHIVIEESTRPLKEKASTCFERKNIKKTGPTRYEATLLDFIPDKEIEVNFLWQ